jgi:hypothetical protein
MSFLPYLAMGLPALLSGVSGVMDIVGSAKKLSGGRIRRKRVVHRKRATYGGRIKMRRPVRHRRGRGIASDIIGQIPLIGQLLGPIVKAMGGRIIMRRGGRAHMMRCRGRGLAPMRYKKPYIGQGMLTPPGGTMVLYAKKAAGYGLLGPAGGSIHRRGHYRHVNGKRVHVKATRVHGGYMPYRF